MALSIKETIQLYQKEYKDIDGNPVDIEPSDNPFGHNWLELLIKGVALRTAKEFIDAVPLQSVYDDGNGNAIKNDAKAYQNAILGICNAVNNSERNAGGGNIFTSIKTQIITLIGMSDNVNANWDFIIAADWNKWEIFVTMNMLEVFEVLQRTTKEGKLEYEPLKIQ